MNRAPMSWTLNYQRSRNRKLLSKIKNTSFRITHARNKTIKSEAGKHITNENDVRENWYQYVKELYNQNVLTDENLLDELWSATVKKKQERGLLDSEVIAAMLKLKSLKVPEVYEINGDLIQHSKWRSNG